MTELLAIVALGFALGMRHACDADHVVAISTIVARHRTVGGAALVGAIWGVGHTVTIMIMGAAIIAFSVVIPPLVALSLEMSVGVMLIVLGAMNLAGVTHRLFHRFTSIESGADHHYRLFHSHVHSHGGEHQFHLHIHLLARGHETVGSAARLRALAVGIVHGLAGSAAITLLVLSTIHDPFWSAIYLAVFGRNNRRHDADQHEYGDPLAVIALRSARVERSLMIGSGLLSLGFGIFIVFRISFWDRLL